MVLRVNSTAIRMMVGLRHAVVFHRAISERICRPRKAESLDVDRSNASWAASFSSLPGIATAGSHPAPAAALTFF